MNVNILLKSISEEYNIEVKWLKEALNYNIVIEELVDQANWLKNREKEGK